MCVCVLFKYVCMRECVQGASVFLKGHVLPGFNIETLDMWTEPLCVPVFRAVLLQRDVPVLDPTDLWLLQHQGPKQSDKPPKPLVAH